MEIRKHRDDTRHNGDSPCRGRAHPTSSHRKSASTSHTTDANTKLKKDNTTATSPSTNGNSKRTGFLGMIFGPGPHQHREPERLIECTACLSDDIRRSKSAKLTCGHRLCNSCLRRVFKLSTTDPQHMPPKCCTSDHIPLKHVDKLFDIDFKKTWNQKFLEYSTNNRIYCPVARCGEWIPPADIHKEGGRKYGKCSHCKTKVCCLCNGKWHESKKCPKDEGTNELLKVAKEAGWQRCYNCGSMVELKAGCNHMTCRCRAQFCMACGAKWNTCSCPSYAIRNGGFEDQGHNRGGDPLAFGAAAAAEYARWQPPLIYRPASPIYPASGSAASIYHPFAAVYQRSPPSMNQVPMPSMSTPTGLGGNGRVNHGTWRSYVDLIPEEEGYYSR